MSGVMVEWAVSLYNIDAVLMSQSHRPTHVGVWVDGAVLHCVRGSGVVYTSLLALKNFPYNICGFYRARY